MQAVNEPPLDWTWPGPGPGPNMRVRDLVRVFHQVVETTQAEKLREEEWRNARRSPRP